MNSYMVTTMLGETIIVRAYLAEQLDMTDIHMDNGVQIGFESGIRSFRKMEESE